MSATSASSHEPDVSAKQLAATFLPDGFYFPLLVSIFRFLFSIFPLASPSIQQQTLRLQVHGHAEPPYPQDVVQPLAESLDNLRPRQDERSRQDRLASCLLLPIIYCHFISPGAILLFDLIYLRGYLFIFGTSKLSSDLCCSFFCVGLNDDQFIFSLLFNLLHSCCLNKLVFMKRKHEVVKRSISLSLTHWRLKYA